MLSKFDELVKQRKELKTWWKLREAVSSYTEKPFKLHIGLRRPEVVTFCGEHTCGGQNYHNAPSFFVDAVRNEFARRAEEVTQAAYEAELARLNSEIEQHRAEVEQMLAEADA